jgi:hypothetical protein
MALQFTYETISGIVITEAYAHITQFVGDKSQISVKIDIYKDKTCRLAGKIPVDKVQALLQIGNGASYQQMYTELKTKPLFKEATDI